MTEFLCIGSTMKTEANETLVSSKTVDIQCIQFTTMPSCYYVIDFFEVVTDFTILQLSDIF